MSTDPESREGFGPFLAGVGPTVSLPGGETHSIRFNNIADLELALKIHGKNVAAFLVEPIQGEAGCVHSILTPCLMKDIFPKFINYARTIMYFSYAMRYKPCDTFFLILFLYLIVCILFQGLGRTGKMLCCEHDGVRPDIVLLGKALSGGGLSWFHV
jgi:ornithine--oxo-acid transaminase